jgi:hypothetical protein
LPLYSFSSLYYYFPSSSLQEKMCPLPPCWKVRQIFKEGSWNTQKFIYSGDGQEGTCAMILLFRQASSWHF